MSETGHDARQDVHAQSDPLPRVKAVPRADQTIEFERVELDEASHRIAEHEAHMGKTAGLLQSFGFAGKGLARAFLQERNLHVDAIFAVIALVACAVLRCEPAEWCAIIVMIGVVCAAEVMNTALETVVDLVTSDYHVLAEHAKDMAAGAVLLCSCTAIVVGIIVYASAFMRFMG